MIHSKTVAKQTLSVLLSVLLVLLLSPAAALAAENEQVQDGASDTASENSLVQQEELADESAEKDQNATVDVLDQTKEGDDTELTAELTASGKVSLVLSDSVFNLSNNPYVEVDGNAVQASSASGGVSISLDIPASASKAAHFLTYYKYENSIASLGSNALYGSTAYDKYNETYPTNMYVWELSYNSNTQTYSATRLSEFDNILKYAGCAVRSTSPQGIRLVTSMPSSAKSTLINSSLSGYQLMETGTMVQWDSKLGTSSLTESSDPMRGKAYSRSSGKNPVYKSGNGLEKYTNVITGFSNETSICQPMLSLRPYMIVQKGGQEYYLYGGTVHRSIGYIASQNTAAFYMGTVGYRFIWGAVHAAYGTKLDSSLEYVDWDIRAHVDSENQEPELHWGCESLALTNTLRGYGFSLEKTTIYDDYLAKSSWDFVNAYAGDARECYGIGLCMPPAITDAANRYLSEKGVNLRAVNITGASFDTVLQYVDQGYPVITWSTSFLDSPNFFGEYIDGYRGYTLLHCLPVVGHDGYNNVTVACSGAGCRLTHDYSLFASIYDQCGRCAVVIL